MGFVDLVILGETVVPCLELKNFTLEQLWHGEHGASGANPPPESLNGLCNHLVEETEANLLSRSVRFWDGITQRSRVTTVESIKRDAIQQITRYLEVMKNGSAQSDSSGVCDQRVKCCQGGAELVGYVVIGLGATRILAYEAKTETTLYSYNASHGELMYV